MSDTALLRDTTIGFVGAGNMAEAIMRGILRAGLAPAGRLLAADPADARRSVFSSCGCTVVDTNAGVAKGSDMLILAVKPQVIDDVVVDLASHIRSDTLVVSIAAGVTCARLEALLPTGARLMRVMPNTPMLAGKGVSAVARGTHADDEDAGRTLAVFSAAGLAREVDESLMDAVTALSGSGPAYFFRFVEALADAGEAAGLPRVVADEFAAGTFIGAAALLESGDASPAELRERVTSPGGTTAAALASLDTDAFAEVIERAVQAAAVRSVELGRA